MSVTAQVRRNLMPEDLDFEGALQLVFPRWDPSKNQTPKRTWIAGKKPDVDNQEDQDIALEQIDLIISNAISARDRQDRRSIVLKSVKDLSERGIACPYYYVRLGIAFAVKQAGLARIEDKFSETNRAEEQEHLHRMAAEVINKIEDLHRQFSADKIYQLTRRTGRFGHAVKEDLIFSTDLIVDLHDRSIATIEAMGKIKSLLLNERQQYVKKGNPDIWMASFITALGQLWFELTGTPPTSKGVFSDFVHRSYIILGGSSDKSWNRRIDTSIKSTPPEIHRDKSYSLVNPASLLACEIETNESLNESDANQIRLALDAARRGDFEKRPNKIIQRIQEHSHLPQNISHLLRRIPWSVEEAFARVLGVTASEVEEDIKFHPSSIH